MSKIKLAGMVTLYNPTDQDIKNIDSYINDIDVLYVIDNTEGKDNKDRLPKSKKIKYIFNNENIGVASALNYACELAIKDGYDYLLTNDQDTFFRENVIKGMKKDIEENDMTNIGIVSPWHNTKLLDKKPTEKYDDPHDVMTSGNILNLKIWKNQPWYLEQMVLEQN